MAKPRRDRAFERLIRAVSCADAAASSWNDSVRAERMRRCIDAMWDELSPLGVSWVGFYVVDSAARDGAPNASLSEVNEMTLAYCRDKPACSPIGLHGACGRSYQSRRMLVVTDVARLGEGYIACDPRDKSEVVVPMFAPAHAATPTNAAQSSDLGVCWGVLDVDSHDAAAFDAEDAKGLWRVCEAAGLTFAPDVARRGTNVGVDMV